MSDITDLYDRLAAASSLEGDDAAIRINATYEPIGGSGDKVSPPTYPIATADKPPYLIENRWDEDAADPSEVVLLDSRQAQANRCEEALLRGIDTGRLALPHLVLSTESNDRTIRITSLDAPHRSRDAYFRDAESGDGTSFDDTAIGQELRGVRPDDASPLYRYSPTDLVYGVWDSHRDFRLATRFPRIYTSELIGWDVLTGLRAAGRFDLVVSGGEKVTGGNQDWMPTSGNSKGKKKLSELGHGSIPPNIVHKTQRGGEVLNPGGVVVRRITRSATVGFAGLARIRFGGSPDPAARAARAVLAALALLGDRLAFGGPAVFVRSGCELVLEDESITWVGRSAGEEQLVIDTGTAHELFDHAVGIAVSQGLAWSTDPIALRPQPKLQEVIDRAFFSSPTEDDGETVGTP